MKIRIHTKPKPDRFRIHITERRLYNCRDCENKYYQLHFFCPQCLGALSVTENQQFELMLLSFPGEKKEELIELLRFFTRESARDFSRSLRSLPWVMIQKSDPAVLQHWKEVLEPAKAEMKLCESPAEKGKRGKAPLYASNAPLPQLLPSTIMEKMRTIAEKLRMDPMGLKWVEASLSSFRLIEGFYKQNAKDRVIFPDYVPRIEEELSQVISIFGESGKSELLEKQIDRLRSSVQLMVIEIEEVKRHIQQQL